MDPRPSEVAQLAELAVATARAVEAVVRNQQALNEGMTALRSDLVTMRREVMGELTHVARDDDVRRVADRMLTAISSAEHVVTGEVRALDTRVGSLADDVRLVRALRDGLESLAVGVESVRQLATRAATSQQMNELTAELATVLREIESARTQVVAFEQSPTPPPAAEVVATAEVVDHLADRLHNLSEVARQLGNGVLEDLRARRKARRRR